MKQIILAQGTVFRTVPAIVACETDNCAEGPLHSSSSARTEVSRSGRCLTSFVPELKPALSTLRLFEVLESLPFQLTILATNNGRFDDLSTTGPPAFKSRETLQLHGREACC